MVWYKAMEKGMICRGKQYEENTDYEEQGADSCCKEGVMHFCKEPFDVLDYYPLIDDNGNFSEFVEVEPKDKILKNGNKYASKKIHIGAKLGFKGFINAAIDFLIEKTNPEKVISGTWAQIGSSGNEARIGSSGDGARVKVEGKDSVVACIGAYSIIKASKGTWITLAEYGTFDGETRRCLCVKSAQIDGEILKENTWYKLENGEFTQVSI